MKGDLRHMWAIIFFDLPVKRPEQRKQATKFRNFLLNDGYIMLQYSVYARVCKGKEAVDKHMNRVILELPSEGSVRALQVTDKQYARMKILLGNLVPEERFEGEQLLFF
ncbi:CRISPR-associated endonuclease Cas2 [Verrucomicrobia bacterium]|nr:CRISPR-associated endonuclease Cas2 [Verrucomicrobiota bacterium]